MQREREHARWRTGISCAGTLMSIDESTTAMVDQQPAGLRGRVRDVSGTCQGRVRDDVRHLLRRVLCGRGDEEHAERRVGRVWRSAPPGR